MKYRTYFIILMVLFILLFYNLFCYSFANKRINENTRYLISNYLKNNELSSNYEYIKATNNNDGTFNIFIKLEDNDNSYYRFIFTINGSYKLVLVNQDIPIYIK